MDLLIPKLGEFIPALVAFVVLWIVLAKVAWPMVTKTLDKRAETIKGDLVRSEAARVESERILEENKAQLEDAKAQAKDIVADATKAAEQVRSDIIEQAQKDANDIVEKAKIAIEAERRSATAQLQAQAADLSVQVAGRVIGKDLSDEEHLSIIERYVAEAGSFNAN